MIQKFHEKPVLYSLLITMFLAFTYASGCAEQQKHHTPASQVRFTDIEHWVKVFEDPERETWQKPDEVLKRLNLTSGDVIADIGAGTGYFTRRFAKAVGPEGKAFGLDIEPSMVEYMREDARKLNLKNYTARVVKPHDPEIEPRSVDVIFLCNTYHHIKKRADYLKRISKSLKSNGRVVIIDFYKRPMPYGPPPEHKMAREEVIGEFQKAGYRLQKSLEFLPYQYFLEFTL